MANPVRFAVVGATGYSRSHLQQVRALSAQGQGQLVASTLIDKADHPDLVSEFKSQGIRVFDRYEDMLAASVGLVDIVTLPVPIHLHAPMAVSALRAGYHTLVEKPLAGSLVQVDEIIAAREASGKQAAVGFQAIYSSVIQQLKEIIVDGRLGQVKRIWMMALWPRNPAYYQRNNWAGKLFCQGHPIYDSPFNNALAHQVMNMLYLASDRPRQAAHPVQVEAELFRAYDIESFDTGCMRIHTDQGVEIMFAASHACETNVDPRMELVADRGRVTWQYQSSATIDYASGATETLRWADDRMSMFHNLVATVRGESPQPSCTLEIAREQVACTEALHQATSILTVRARFISELNGGQRVISGVSHAVQQTLAAGQLFSESGAAFAAA